MGRKCVNLPEDEELAIWNIQISLLVDEDRPSLVRVVSMLHELFVKKLGSSLKMLQPADHEGHLDNPYRRHHLTTQIQ